MDNVRERLSPPSVVACAGLCVALFVALGPLGRGLLSTTTLHHRGFNAPRTRRLEPAHYGELPLSFVRAGKTAETTELFRAQTAEAAVVVGPLGAKLLLGTTDPHTISLDLRGAAEDAEAASLQRLPGVVNDLRGNDRTRWRTDVPTYERVRYSSVYPGVDLDWHGNGRRLEYDFRLAPGADASQIALRVGGADSLQLTSSGDLLIRADDHTIRQPAPVAWQQSRSGERDRVHVSFSLEHHTIGFMVGAHDPNASLVIDPLVLSYSTYLGGDDGQDTATAIAVDSSKAAYVTGQTSSTNFDTLGEVELNSNQDDVFVSKINPAGNALVYSTYIGGNSIDRASAIAVDSNGAAYVAGWTSGSDYNVVGGIEGDSSGDDVIISKLAPAGNSLTYSTYLGGGNEDRATGIAVDSGGSAYVTGYTKSSDFDTMNPIEGDVPPTADPNVFVSKVNSAGSALTYSTYVGGTNDDRANAIAIDSSGAAYIAGETLSINYDTTVGGIGDADGVKYDAFVTKLVTAGTSLAYSTYLGGTAEDRAYGIAVDSSGAAYVTGDTFSANFNRVGGIEGRSAGSAQDAFITKVKTAGNGLDYSTFLGGSEIDSARAIAVDSTGSAYVVGYTNSNDFNVLGEVEGNEDAAKDVFVSKIKPPGNALRYSTYLGGCCDDFGLAIALDTVGNAYIAGYTQSAGPAAGDEYDTKGEIEGDSGDDTSADAIISKLHYIVDTKPPDTIFKSVPPKTVKTGGNSATVSFRFSSTEKHSTFKCKIDGGAFKACSSPRTFKLKLGSHAFQVRATDLDGNTDKSPAKRTFKIVKK